MKIWCNLQVIINPYQDVTQTDWNLLIIKFLRKTKSTYFFLFKIKWKMGSIDSRTIQNLLDRIFLPPLTLGKTFSVCTEYSREEKQYFSAMLPLQVSLIEWVKFSLPFISGGGGGQCNIFALSTIPGQIMCTHLKTRTTLIRKLIFTNKKTFYQGSKGIRQQDKLMYIPNM